MKPEDKLKIAMSMVDAVTGITAENERERNPGIKEAELIAHLRRRFQRGRRPR